LNFHRWGGEKPGALSSSVIGKHGVASMVSREFLGTDLGRFVGVVYYTTIITVF
jgi:hypothetical protein